MNIKATTPAKSGTTTVTKADGTVDVIPATKPGGVDINAVGTIDGVELFDVDLDGAEDKPWRKPGADLTDYFNYGFNENIWRAYCHKQKMMRDNPFAGGKVYYHICSTTILLFSMLTKTTKANAYASI